MSELYSKTLRFIDRNSVGSPGEYTFCIGGQVSLYASCFAALGLHTIGALDKFDFEERNSWCEYINQWQDSDTGLFLGPELASAELTRSDLDEEYIRLHLTVHVLPTLEILGGQPAYKLTFARKFAEKDYLAQWLEARDWRQAWKEGNNLLFAGMLLVYLLENESHAPAEEALEYYFDWLDSEQDPETGLWGTNGYCSTHEALYGAYHQLLVYHYCDRNVRFSERIIDTVLDLQQIDGSFTKDPGGGACEDVDAIDVLVNLAKRTSYRLPDVQQSAISTLHHIKNQQYPRGGFVYRWNSSFMQSGVLRTFTEKNQPDLFSTWFRLNTLALINEIISDAELEKTIWRFNPSCSMGWHDSDLSISRAKTSAIKSMSPRQISTVNEGSSKLSKASFRTVVEHIMTWIPNRFMVKLSRFLFSTYLSRMTPEETFGYLQPLEEFLNSRGNDLALELANGLPVEYWWSQSYRYFSRNIYKGARIWHLGCLTGSLSFTLASQTYSWIIASDHKLDNLSDAANRYRHQRLEFMSPKALLNAVPVPDIVILTDWADGSPAWSDWDMVLQGAPLAEILVQLDPSPRRWKEIAASQHSSSSQEGEIVPKGDVPISRGSIIDVELDYGVRFVRIVPSKT